MVVVVVEIVVKEEKEEELNIVGLVVSDSHIAAMRTAVSLNVGLSGTSGSKDLRQHCEIPRR